MAETDTQSLFSPIRIGNLVLPNRFIVPSMQRGAGRDGAPTLGMRDYLAARVRGGFALIMSESCAIDHPVATSQPTATHMTSATAGAWAQVIAGVHAEGGRMFMQLWHEGATRRRDGAEAMESVSPSGLIRAGVQNGRAATIGDLDAIRDAYVRSARMALDAGADGIEIHACHGYLLDQFLWNETNLRTDCYGGPELVRRLRFPLDIIRAVRDVLGPHVPLSIRLSQWKEADFDAICYPTRDAIRTVVEAFEGAGVSMFHISQRRFYQAASFEQDRSLAGIFKAHSRLPVVVAGGVGLDTELRDMVMGDGPSRVRARESVEELARRFNRGEFDLVSVGRASIGDGDWVRKVRDGRFDDIRAFERADLGNAQEWDTFAFDAGHM